MKFKSIEQALFELHNIARGGSMRRDESNELIVVNPKAKISSKRIHSTIVKSEITQIVFANKVLSDIREHLSDVEIAFMSFYWGYEDLFDVDVSMNALSDHLCGGYAVNRCYILYYRDKNKRCDVYSELANVMGIARRTAQDLLHGKYSDKRSKLNQLYADITNCSSIEEILEANELSAMP